MFPQLNPPTIEPTTDKIVFDEKDAGLLANRMAWRQTLYGPRVGDYCILPARDLRRFAHEYSDRLQVTSKDGASSFYFDDLGTMSHSGGLDEGIKKDRLVELPYLRSAPVWFFHHNISGGHRGVHVIAPVRVWEVLP